MFWEVVSVMLTVRIWCYAYAKTPEMAPAVASPVRARPAMNDGRVSAQSHPKGFQQENIAKLSSNSNLAGDMV